MSSREKILIILTPAFPANESEVNWVPSQQLFIHAVKKIFPEIKVIVLSFLYPGDLSYTWNGIKVFGFDGMRYRKIKRPLLWRKIWLKLSELNKQNRITAILSFWCGECALVGRYFGKRNSVNHFTWICGQDARATNKYVKLIRPLPGELIAKSDFLADEFYRNHRIRPAHVITNGIDESVIPQVQIKDIDIIGVGSLSFIKQYDQFVEIIADLQKTIPAIKAVLCGDGEAKEQINQLRNNFSINENLIMTGMVTPQEAFRLMQRARILLHPSSYEGFSMTCLEALYAGAHVISFVKPMHHEIKNWHIVKTKDQMTKKALELLNDPQIKYESVKVFSMEDSAAKMMELLRLTD